MTSSRHLHPICNVQGASASGYCHSVLRVALRCSSLQAKVYASSVVSRCRGCVRDSCRTVSQSRRVCRTPASPFVHTGCGLLRCGIVRHVASVLLRTARRRKSNASGMNEPSLLTPHLVNLLTGPDPIPSLSPGPFLLSNSV